MAEMSGGGGVDLIREWWSAIMFAIGGISAFIVQRERTRWQLSTLGDELAGIKEALKELRAGQAEHALLGAELRTEIANLKQRLDRGGK